MKLRSNKNGNGKIGNYTISIGSAEARKCGLINDNGDSLEIEKILLPEENSIIIKLKKEAPPK